MAKTGLKPGHRKNEKWVEKIQTSKLLKKLEGHALSSVHGIQIVKGRVIDKGAKTRMLDSQIRAAEILLRKVVPDVNRTTHEGGDDDKPIKFESRQIIVNPVRPK